MVVIELNSVSEFENLLKETENYELGKIVIMIYEEGPVYENMKLIYELISRESPDNKYYAMHLEACANDDVFCEKYDLFSYPVFLIMKYGNVMQRFETSTSMYFLSRYLFCN